MVRNPREFAAGTTTSVPFKRFGSIAWKLRRAISTLLLSSPWMPDTTQRVGPGEDPRAAHRAASRKPPSKVRSTEKANFFFVPGSTTSDVRSIGPQALAATGERSSATAVPVGRATRIINSVRAIMLTVVVSFRIGIRERSLYLFLASSPRHELSPALANQLAHVLSPAIRGGW